MKYEVKYDELYDLGDYIGKKDEDIKSIYDDIERLIRSIPEDKTWDGVDYQNYLNSFIEFLQKERRDELQLENLSILLRNVARFYKDNDEEWGNSMRKTIKNPVKKENNEDWVNTMKNAINSRKKGS